MLDEGGFFLILLVWVPVGLLEDSSWLRMMGWEKERESTAKDPWLASPERERI